MLYWGFNRIGILPGQYWDEESGLHWNWQRYYDPVSGRYVKKDPIGFDAGDNNLYRYVQNNPVNYIDPLGLTAMEWAVPLSIIISQLDTPLPGPADVIAGGIIGVAWLIDHPPDDYDAIMAKKYGGYKEGKPCPPKGYEPGKMPKPETVNSQDFKDFIRWKHGSYKKQEWGYIMQKYYNPRTGAEFKYHFWRHISGRTYYHLR